MNASNRNLIFHLVQNHRRVNSLSKLKLTELVADAESALAAARSASASKDKQLREIAEKVMAGLTLEMSSDENSHAPKAPLAKVAALAPKAPLAKVSAPAPGIVRTYKAEWELLENITLDHAGPMGLHRLNKIHANNPGVNPKSLKGEFETALDKEMANAIFGLFIG